MIIHKSLHYRDNIEVLHGNRERKGNNQYWLAYYFGYPTTIEQDTIQRVLINGQQTTELYKTQPGKKNNMKNKIPRTFLRMKIDNCKLKESLCLQGIDLHNRIET